MYVCVDACHVVPTRDTNVKKGRGEKDDDVFLPISRRTMTMEKQLESLSACPCFQCDNFYGYSMIQNFTMLKLFRKTYSVSKTNLV